MAAAAKKDYTFAVGRRKSSIARVRLFSGRATSLVNAMPYNEYFKGAVASKLWERPFEVTKTEGKYWVSVKVVGGGKEGQLGASIHGISRALALINADSFKSPLRQAGLLTRDARSKESRKVGTGGKARRKKSSPKR